MIIERAQDIRQAKIFIWDLICTYFDSESLSDVLFKDKVHQPRFNKVFCSSQPSREAAKLRYKRNRIREKVIERENGVENVSSDESDEEEELDKSESFVQTIIVPSVIVIYLFFF